MKTIHQLFHEFKQLPNPSDDDYMKLGHDLATNIVFAPKNEHELLWHFVNSKFPKDKNELINFGAAHYIKLKEQQEEMAAKLNKMRVEIAPKEEKNIVNFNKEPEIIKKLDEKIAEPKERDEHKERIAEKVKEIRENVEKLDNNISNLKEIKNPGFSMKMAIDALEKFRDEMNEKHKPKK